MSDAVVRWSALASASSWAQSSGSSRIERATVVIPVTIGDVETVRYTYRLRPGAQAERALIREADMARAVWNLCVETDRDLRKECGAKLSGVEMDRFLLRLWHVERPWLAEGSSVVQQQVVADWAKARKFVKGKGAPRFHSKRKARPSMNYTRSGFKVRDGRLRLAGGIVVPVVWSRDPPSDPSSVRVYRDAVGDWWASFVVQREPEQFPAADAAIGIDWGVKTVATTTDERFDLPHAEHGRKAAKRLAHYQRQMARRKPKPGKAGSKGYRKAKLTVAKQHRKVARQRQDTARKWARSVVVAHDKIAVEDFKPKFLAKSTMARKAADGTIGATKRELLAYGERAGRTVVLVPPAYTTMTCSCCGARAKRLPLDQRTFACPECGLVLDRDVNAARTILAAAGLNGADVDCVRHAMLSSEHAA